MGIELMTIGSEPNTFALSKSSLLIESIIFLNFFLKLVLNILNSDTLVKEFLASLSNSTSKLISSPTQFLGNSKSSLLKFQINASTVFVKSKSAFSIVLISSGD